MTSVVPATAADDCRQLPEPVVTPVSTNVFLRAAKTAFFFGRRRFFILNRNRRCTMVFVAPERYRTGARPHALAVRGDGNSIRSCAALRFWEWRIVICAVSRVSSTMYSGGPSTVMSRLKCRPASSLLAADEATHRALSRGGVFLCIYTKRHTITVVLLCSRTLLG